MACGDVGTAVGRVNAHFDAGASHVSVQVLQEDSTSIPQGQWRDLASALNEVT